MEKKIKIGYSNEVILTQENIDDIMSSALDSISYWCDAARVMDKYLGEYASEQISRGGSLALHDMEESKYYVLTLDKFVRGFKKWVEDGYDRYGAVNGSEVDCGEIDGDMADLIIQLALFGDVIYG